MPIPHTALEALEQAENMLYEVRFRIQHRQQQKALVFAEIVRDKVDRLIKLLEKDRTADAGESG